MTVASNSEARKRLEGGTARYLIGDVFDRMAALEDGSVDLVLTSPPFLALRSYLPADHPDKGKEIGSEPTPAAFLDTLLHLTAEWRRLLTPGGSICVELGDTYSGSGGAGGDYAEGGLRDGQQAFSGSASKRARLGVGDDYRPARKGRTNPPNTAHRLHPDGSIKTTAAARATEPKNRAEALPPNSGPGWPLPKSLCGIPHLYHLSLAYGRNLLTGEASPAGQWRVRNVVAWCRPNPPVGALGDKFRPGVSYMTVACVSGQRYFDLDAVRHAPKNGAEAGSVGGSTTGYRGITEGGAREGRNLVSDPAGAPPLDWWEIPTQPYAGSHYATWPKALCEKPIKAMCPPGGLVLDPFAGSGTTLAVATGLGRKAIGIDIDSRNAELARERVGMFLTVEDQERVA